MSLWILSRKRDSKWRKRIVSISIPLLGILAILGILLAILLPLVSRLLVP